MSSDSVAFVMYEKVINAYTLLGFCLFSSSFFDLLSQQHTISHRISHWQLQWQVQLTWWYDHKFFDHFFLLHLLLLKFFISSIDTIAKLWRKQKNFDNLVQWNLLPKIKQKKSDYLLHVLYFAHSRHILDVRQALFGVFLVVLSTLHRCIFTHIFFH